MKISCEETNKTEEKTNPVPKSENEKNEKKLTKSLSPEELTTSAPKRSVTKRNIFDDTARLFFNVGFPPGIRGPGYNRFKIPHGPHKIKHRPHKVKFGPNFKLKPFPEYIPHEHHKPFHFDVPHHDPKPFLEPDFKPHDDFKFKPLKNSDPGKYIGPFEKPFPFKHEFGEVIHEEEKPFDHEFVEIVHEEKVPFNHEFDEIIHEEENPFKHEFEEFNHEDGSFFNPHGFGQVIHHEEEHYEELPHVHIEVHDSIPPYDTVKDKPISTFEEHGEEYILTHSPQYINSIAKDNIYYQDVPKKEITNSRDKVHGGLAPAGLKGLDPVAIHMLEDKLRPYV